MSTDPEAVHRYARHVSREVLALLYDLELLPADRERQAAQRQLLSVGAEHWRRLTEQLPYRELDAFYGGLREAGVSPTALPRILGFAAEQSRAFQHAVLGTSREAAGWQGAVFNLAVVLFDLVCDRIQAQATALRQALDPAQLAIGVAPVPVQAGPVVRYTIQLTTRLLTDLHAASRPDRFRLLFGQALRQMYLGQTQAMRYVFSAAPPAGMRTWLRSKSVLPAWTMALIACADDEAGLIRFLAHDAGVRAFGRCLWIVDDLCDAPEDAARGAWSRISLALVSRGRPPDDLTAAIEDGVVAAEVGQLRAAVGAVPPACRGALARTLSSWVVVPNVPVRHGTRV